LCLLTSSASPGAKRAPPSTCLATTVRFLPLRCWRVSAFRIKLCVGCAWLPPLRCYAIAVADGRGSAPGPSHKQALTTPRAVAVRFCGIVLSERCVKRTARLLHKHLLRCLETRDVPSLPSATIRARVHISSGHLAWALHGPSAAATWTVALLGRAAAAARRRGGGAALCGARALQQTLLPCLRGASGGSSGGGEHERRSTSMTGLLSSNSVGRFGLDVGYPTGILFRCATAPTRCRTPTLP